MVNKNKLINNKNMVSLLIVLALILIISSSIVCYIIGRNSGVSSNGKIIDTIIIEEPQNTDELPVYLTGKILYSDGMPYQGTVRLFSKMKETKTDKNGAFLFKNIVYGKHTLLIVDDSGNVISEMSLTINQNTTDKIIIKKSQNGYEINLGINIALIEINIEVDKEKKELIINEDNITVINYNGNVITPNQISTMQANAIETFNGNKIIPEGIIVLINKGVILSNGTFISNTGQINYSEGETSLPNGFKVGSDGTITLPNKTIIQPDGKIIRFEEAIKPIGSGDEGNEEIEPTGNNDEENEEIDNSISEEETDPLTWDLPIIKQGNMRWDQLTTLDLFANNDSIIDGKIYPGVSGEYEFSIQNDNPYNILFSMDIKEQEHEAGSINLSYRLKYYDETLNKYIYVIGNNNTYLKPNELSTTDKVTLLSNSNITYILEWTWANENNKAQDLKDGKVGTNNNKTHFVDMTIYIENE